MTPKNNSTSDLKPEDLYMFYNEDVNDISEASEHLEISQAAEIFMEIYKFKTPRVIVHNFFIQPFQNDWVFSIFKFP